MKRDCFKKCICEICRRSVPTQNKFFNKYNCELDKKPSNKENCFYFYCNDVGKNRNCTYCSFKADREIDN